ncbi:MAG: hypothetical protein JO020_25830 [Chloroflexi bacterium]|nr:hypothetical protein [Chloroflexota bacterium]MBV9897594.1 hypothetical protein [Chloroflexota bacterium]
MLRALAAGLLVGVVLTACAQAAPPAPTAEPTSAIEGVTPVVGTVEGHFNPTEAIGQGANSSSSVTDIASVFASVQQASQLRITANSSPPGATGADVQTVSILAQDAGGVLKGLNADGKQALGTALLNAAATAWPNASISLLISDPSGTSGTIIGNHPKGGQNTVIAS